MKNDHEHSFRRNLLICLGTALGICAAVELTCVSLGVAPLFTASPAINEKMRFLREHPPGHTPIGVISGASIALNDIDSDLLEDDEGRPFVNLGANGVSVPTSEQFYQQLAALYPVREVIFAASPIEMRDAYRAEVHVPTSVFRRYVLGRMTMAEEFTYRDIPGLISYVKNWHEYHSRTSGSSLAFTKTGAVPLEVSVDAAGRRTWNGEAVFDLTTDCVHCMDDLAQFCRDVRGAGLPFTVVVGPIWPEVTERLPRIRAIVANRRAQLRAVAQQCNATLFDITDYATLDDPCFANSLHLNAQGMSAMTAQFVRFRRGQSIPKGMALPCGGSRVARESNSGAEKAPGSQASSE
jgi:hypothetical protein